MSLSPEQRDDLRRLLARELRAASRAALAEGVDPDELAGTLDDRRRTLAGDEDPRGEPDQRPG